MMKMMMTMAEATVVMKLEATTVLCKADPPEYWMFDGYVSFLFAGAASTAAKEYRSDIWAEKDAEPVPGEGKKGDGRGAQHQKEMDKKN
jgi:hypothetical protein